MLERFFSWHLFGWRMVDFLRNAGMIISVMELIPKPEDTTMSLSQTVKACSSTIKAEEIADVSNATIVDRETAELLENKPRKTLEEIRSLDWHHIVECYKISPELLTENFISKYGNYNHMKCLGLIGSYEMLVLIMKRLLRLFSVKIIEKIGSQPQLELRSIESA